MNVALEFGLCSSRLQIGHDKREFVCLNKMSATRHSTHEVLLAGVGHYMSSSTSLYISPSFDPIPHLNVYPGILHRVLKIGATLLLE